MTRNINLLSRTIWDANSVEPEKTAFSRNNSCYCKLIEKFVWTLSFRFLKFQLWIKLKNEKHINLRMSYVRWNVKWNRTGERQVVGEQQLRLSPRGGGGYYKNSCNCWSCTEYACTCSAMSKSSSHPIRFNTSETIPLSVHGLCPGRERLSVGVGACVMTQTMGKNNKLKGKQTYR